MKDQPKTPEERGAWPEPPGLDNFSEPVEVSIILERPIYDWLSAYVMIDEGCTSFTASVERTLETFIRALAKDGIDLDFVKNNLVPVEFDQKIEWPKFECDDDDWPEIW